MKSLQPLKNELSKGRTEAQPPRERRFRIVKLEERIAPAKGGSPGTHKPTCACYTLVCTPTW